MRNTEHCEAVQCSQCWPLINSTIHCRIMIARQDDHRQISIAQATSHALDYSICLAMTVKCIACQYQKMRTGPICCSKNSAKTGSPIATVQLCSVVVVYVQIRSMGVSMSSRLRVSSFAQCLYQA